MKWPEALRDIIVIVTIGWIIFSFSSCTARYYQVKFHFMENNRGVAIW